MMLSGSSGVRGRGTCSLVTVCSRARPSAGAGGQEAHEIVGSVAEKRSQIEPGGIENCSKDVRFVDRVGDGATDGHDKRHEHDEGRIDTALERCCIGMRWRIGKSGDVLRRAIQFSLSRNAERAPGVDLG
jgi:hypothetical protein